MENLELILSQNEERGHKHVLKYYNYFKSLLKGETIKLIFVQNNPKPDAIIITNKSLLLCRYKRILGDSFEIRLFTPLVAISSFLITEGSTTDTVSVVVSRSNQGYGIADVTKKASLLLKDQLDKIVDTNKPIWDKLISEQDY